MQNVMKKTLLIVVAVLGFAAVASAQPRAIGIRSGWGFDFSYEHTLKGPNFAEFEIGMDGYAFNAFHVDATYNLDSCGNMGHIRWPRSLSLHVAVRECLLRRSTWQRWS